MPIAGGLAFTPNNPLVPVKNGWSNVIDFAPAPDAMLVVLCSVLLWNSANYPSWVTLISWFVSCVDNTHLNLNVLPLKVPFANFWNDP